MSKLIHFHVKWNNNIFTIYGCGKFRNECKTLSKAEASLLYIELHKFLTQENDKEIRPNTPQ